MPLPVWNRPGVAYNVGDLVTLYPYEPVRPHGLGQYHSNPLPKDHRYGELRNFAQSDRRHHAKVKITEAIKFGVNRKSQIFGCQVVEFPSEERPKFYQEPLSIVDPDTKQRKPLNRRLVAKAIDYGYFPSSFGGPYDNTEDADGIFSRIHAAYAYFRFNKRTGYPHTMPQFYGGWAMKVNGGTDGAGNPQIRLVGLILIEHIDGYSIEELCYRNGGDDGVETEYLGKLIPAPGPVGFLGNDNQWTHVIFDLEKRQLVIQMMLHGLVSGFQLGVEHHHCRPWNVFITMKDGETDLRELRVVFLDHNHTQVWHETKFAEKYGRTYCLQKLPHPPHPFLRCNVNALEEFHGWWPPAYGDQPEGIPTTQSDKWRNKVFDAWLKKVFGPVVNSPWTLKRLPISDTKQPNTKQLDTKRPYANKTYSTFELLDYFEKTNRIVQAICKLAENHPEGERNLEGEELAKQLILNGLRPYTVSGTRHPMSSQYKLPMAYKLSPPTGQRKVSNLVAKFESQSTDVSTISQNPGRTPRGFVSRVPRPISTQITTPSTVSPVATPVTLTRPSFNVPSRVFPSRNTPPLPSSSRSATPGDENRPPRSHPPSRESIRSQTGEALQPLSRTQGQRTERTTLGTMGTTGTTGTTGIANKPGPNTTPGIRRPNRPSSIRIPPSDSIDQPKSADSARAPLGSLANFGSRPDVSQSRDSPTPTTPRARRGADLQQQSSTSSPGRRHNRQQSSSSTRGRGHSRQQSTSSARGRGHNRQQSSSSAQGPGHSRQQSTSSARGDSITLPLRRRENRPSQGPTTPTASAQQFPGQENRSTSSSQEEMDLDDELGHGY